MDKKRLMLTLKVMMIMDILMKQHHKEILDLLMKQRAQTGSQSVGPNDVGNVSGLESILNDAVPDNINTMTGYGPPRQDRSLHTRATSSATPVANMTPVDPNTPLQAALQRAHELLDTGNIRAVRGQFGVPGPFTRTENTEDNGKEHDAFLCSEITDDERNMEYFETFMAQSMHEEIQMKDMTEHEHEHLHRGQEEWQKLLKTNSVKIISGREATRIKEEKIKKDRILKSRYVKTRKPDPLFPDETIIKHRWVIKGYLDPDLELLQRRWLTCTEYWNPTELLPDLRGVQSSVKFGAPQSPWKHTPFVRTVSEMWHCCIWGLCMHIGAHTIPNANHSPWRLLIKCHRSRQTCVGVAWLSCLLQDANSWPRNASLHMQSVLGS